MRKEINRVGTQRIFSEFNTVIKRDNNLFNVVKGMEVLAVGLTFDDATIFLKENRSEEEEYSLTDSQAGRRAGNSSRHVKKGRDGDFSDDSFYQEAYILPFKIGG